MQNPYILFNTYCSTNQSKRALTGWGVGGRGGSGGDDRGLRAGLTDCHDEEKIAVNPEILVCL